MSKMLSLSDFNFSFQNIKRRKLRTILTVLGIILGIFLVSSLLFLGAGVKEGIKEQFNTFGKNTISINAGSSYTESTVADVFSDQDIEDITALKSVKKAIGFYEGVLVFKWREEEQSAFIIGFDSEFSEFLQEMKLIDLKEGRLLRKGDICNVIVSEQFAQNAFSKELKVNSTINTINKSMQIVGITRLPAIYTTIGMTGIIYTSKECAKQFGIDTPVELYVEAVSEFEVDRAIDEIDKLLYKNHNNTEDYIITSTANALEMTDSIISIVEIVILAIAAISLVVGGVVVSNTMYMTTMERTKEIGTMKAIGATKKKILFIIVSESAILGLIGGSLGILLGLFVFYLATLLYPLSFTVSFFTIFLILAFSVFLGAVSGYLPAKKASEMDAVEALHYE